MLKKNSSNFKISIITFSIILSFISMYFGHEVWGGVVGMSILVLLAIYLSKFDLLSPLTWFVPFFFLYSISFPVLVEIGERPFAYMLQETLMLQWTALATFIIVFGAPKKPEFNYNKKKLFNIDKIAFPVHIVSFFFTLVFIGYVVGNGLSSKYDIALDQSIYVQLFPFFSIYILSFIILVSHSILVKEKVPIKLMAFTLCYTVFALLIIGERDLSLRVILAIVFLTHTLHKRISRKKIVMLGVLILALIPAMSSLKNVIVREPRVAEERSLLGKLLDTEFSAASKNLNTLLTNDGMWDFQKGETFWWDLKVILGTGGSPTRWFNELYFPETVSRGGGNGFTVVGEGYVNFGIFGIILIFAFLAVFLKFLYKKASTNIMWLAVYLTSIPITVYMIRADLGTLLTQISKQVMLPILIIYILKLLIEGNKMRMKRKNSSIKSLTRKVKLQKSKIGQIKV